MSDTPAPPPPVRAAQDLDYVRNVGRGTPTNRRPNHSLLRSVPNETHATAAQWPGRSFKPINNSRPARARRIALKICKADGQAFKAAQRAMPASHAALRAKTAERTAWALGSGKLG